MALTVELETNTEVEQTVGGGEVEEYTVLTAVRFTDGSNHREIDPQGSEAVLRAPDGTRFDVNASYHLGAPEIWVETTMDDIEDGEYISERFTSVSAFEEWIAEHDIVLE